MRNRSRSDARLIRERRPFEPLDQGTDKAACNAETSEGTFEDLAKRPPDLVIVHQQDNQCCTDIENAHERHDLFGHIGDGFDPTDDHGKDHSSKDDACDPSREVTDNTGNLRMRLIGLEHVSAAKRAKNTEDREHDREDLPARQAQFIEAFRDIVHRTARDGAVLVFIPILHAERTFGELGGHTKQARQDHPEGCTRPANTNSDSDPGNVPETDRARQRRGKRLKMADLARIFRVRVVSFDQLDCVSEKPKLYKTKIQSENRGGDNQPHDDPGKTGPR